MRSRREARLRPEFASHYPGLEPSVWQVAAEVAGRVFEQQLLESGEEPPLSSRILPDEHFEFRGSAPPGGWLRRALSRLSDR
jgi:hypothetical protein